MDLRIVCCVVVAAVSVGSVDEESLKERRCFHPKAYHNIDLEWFTSVKHWYFPMSSRLEAFRFASDILERQVGDIPESVLKESCPHLDKDYNAIGFGSKTAGKYDRARTKYADVARGHDLVFTVKGHSKYSRSATHVVTLTDNKNFVAGVTCWDDDEGAFLVWTPNTNPLSAQVKRQILEHLNELGFDPNFHVEIPCLETESETKTEL